MGMTTFRLKMRGNFLTVFNCQNMAKRKWLVHRTHSRRALSSSHGTLELQVCFTASFPLMLPISTFSFLSAYFISHI